MGNFYKLTAATKFWCVFQFRVFFWTWHINDGHLKLGTRDLARHSKPNVLMFHYGFLDSIKSCHHLIGINYVSLFITELIICIPYHHSALCNPTFCCLSANHHILLNFFYSGYLRPPYTSFQVLQPKVELNHLTIQYINWSIAYLFSQYE